jgi:hypothetical protein
MTYEHINIRKITNFPGKIVYYILYVQCNTKSKIGSDNMLLGKYIGTRMTARKGKIIRGNTYFDKMKSWGSLEMRSRTVARDCGQNYNKNIL